MQYLITGASGLIGTALVTALESDGNEVRTLVRPGSAAREGSISWDPATGQIDERALESAGQFDTVVHLAGAGIADRRWSKARKRELVESRIKSTQLLVSAIADGSLHTKSLISGSAIGVYGDRGGQLLVEGSTKGAGFLADLCEDWEQAAQGAAAHGVRTVLARTGIVLSTKGGALAKQLPLFRTGVGGRLGRGTQWVSWISIDDEVAALRALAIDERAQGTFNLTAPHPVTNTQFTKALGAVLKRPAVLPVPPSALKMALGAELVDEALLASQRVLPEKLESLGFTFEHPELEETLASLLS